MNKLGKEILIFILIIFSIYFGLTYLTTKVFFLCRVQQTSMENTLLPNQILLGKRQHFTSATITRGTIVVFSQAGVLLIKRVIGLPGEHLVIKNGKIYINAASLALEEKYRLPDTSGKKLNFENVMVPSDSVFFDG